MTPSFRVLPDGTVRQVYFYCVDVSEFVVNKPGRPRQPVRPAAS